MKLQIFTVLVLLTSLTSITACNKAESKKVVAGEGQDMKTQAEDIVKKYKEEEMASRNKGGVRENLKFYLTKSSPAKGLTEVSLTPEEKIYVQRTPIITSSDIATVKTKEDSEGSEFRIDLNAEGTKKMHAATKDNIGKRIAFYFNDEFCSAPIIREAIDSGSIMAFKPKATLPTRH